MSDPFVYVPWGAANPSPIHSDYTASPSWSASPSIGTPYVANGVHFADPLVVVESYIQSPNSAPYNVGNSSSPPQFTPAHPHPEHIRLHSWLCANAWQGDFLFDLSSPHFKPMQIISHSRREAKFIPEDLMLQQATLPGLVRLRIVCKHLPQWPIEIPVSFSQTNPSATGSWPSVLASSITTPDSHPLSIFDVLKSIHKFMQTRITRADWERLNVDEASAASTAYSQRCKAYGAEAERAQLKEGVKRVDLLAGKVWFRGLAIDWAGGVLNMVVVKPDGTFPPDYALTLATNHIATGGIANQTTYTQAATKQPTKSHSAFPISSDPDPLIPASSHADNQASRIQQSFSTIQTIRSKFQDARSSFTFPSLLDFRTDNPERPLSVPTNISLDLVLLDRLKSQNYDLESVDKMNNNPPKLAYTQVNAPLHSHSEFLVRLLTSLDEIESFDSEDIRRERLALVRAVDEEAERIERRWKEAWTNWVEALHQQATLTQIEADIFTVRSILLPDLQSFLRSPIIKNYSRISEQLCQCILRLDALTLDPSWETVRGRRKDAVNEVQQYIDRLEEAWKATRTR